VLGVYVCGHAALERGAHKRIKRKEGFAKDIRKIKTQNVSIKEENLERRKIKKVNLSLRHAVEAPTFSKESAHR
jgi:ABC-type phosphate transport system auxiliary subunit